MPQHLSVGLLLLVALMAANLPFLSERVCGLVPLRGGRKPVPARLLELVFMYFLAGAMGLLLEDRAGQIVPQGWEFYAVTGALFITLAFPGFVWRFLWRHASPR